MHNSMLLSEIDSIREEIVISHYEKAKQELKEKVKSNPLKTEYTLFESEPIQFEMATEISKRLATRNKCDTSVNTRFFSSLATISVKLPLSSEEIKQIEEAKPEEVKLENTEEPKPEDIKTEEAKI